MRTIATKAPKEVKVVAESEKQEDYYKGFRSAVVLVWMFCNFALCAVVLSAGGLETVQIGKDKPGVQRSTIYMGVVLWSVAGLSLFRFCGAIWFLVVRLVSLSCWSWHIELLVMLSWIILLTVDISFAACEHASLVLGKMYNDVSLSSGIIPQYAFIAGVLPSVVYRTACIKVHG